MDKNRHVVDAYHTPDPHWQPCLCVPTATWRLLDPLKCPGDKHIVTFWWPDCRALRTCLRERLQISIHTPFYKHIFSVVTQSYSEHGAATSNERHDQSRITN